jgi:hypothetical protein
MNRKRTICKFFMLFIVFPLTLNAQQYWQSIHPDLVISSGKRQIAPGHFKSYYFDMVTLKEHLLTLKEGYEHADIIQLPDPDGSAHHYRIWATPIMEPALASKYPEIKTFTAEAIDNKQITAKIDLSPAGFHAMIYDGQHTYFIDPYSDVEDGNYICYYKKDCLRTGSATCSVLNDNEEIQEPHDAIGMKTHGTQRRNYRLALACTYEYSVAVGGATPTKASVLAQMVLIMNRVNGVYEREFSSTMTLVANTDTLIYLTSSDPYTNNNGGTMLSQNITTINNRIGSANYDIGHVFSTGGGGVAYLACICNSNKAGGVTGLPNPVGDPFAIDYVAHEMGHQFGSDHTFNSNLGSCSGNGASALAFEPGSGSTIMAYAGICGTDDLQNNSDAYFHAGSLRAIVNNITTGSGGTCPVITASTNVPNTYPDFTQTRSIPLWTPFELTAPTVVDATQDTLSYCWEEWDLGGFGQQWNTTNTAMPYFRSFSPTSSSTRIFPTMNNVLAGNYFYKGERLPQAARTLKFVLTTRDIFQGWGSFNSSYDTDTVTLNAVNTGDTFRVTSQATAATMNIGSTQTVTWNVAGTTAAPVNAATVNIYLSIDSAKTFPYVLASGVPNNGSTSVIIPSIPASTTKGRIKVKGANNVFFQVNRSNITINVVPLPIDLTSFTADAKDCNVQLNWTTGTSEHFSHFELQKSRNGTSFETVGSIQSGTDNKYNYTNKQVGDGNYFYRLKMIDTDGKTTYSAIISVSISCNNENNLVVFPNPTHDKVFIKSNGNIKEAILMATNGQTVHALKGNSEPEIEMNIKNLPAGLYLLRITKIDGSYKNFKVVKE